MWDELLTDFPKLNRNEIVFHFFTIVEKRIRIDKLTHYYPCKEMLAKLFENFIITLILSTINI